MSMLDIKGIETSYGETQVLFDVSLNIAPGEVVSLPVREAAYYHFHVDAGDNSRQLRLHFEEGEGLGIPDLEGAGAVVAEEGVHHQDSFRNYLG